MEKEIDSKEPKQEFHCEIDGCKQSFTTEVHRNVHTKKHDLSLNLEMPLKGAAGGLFADQTPTPTRLIGKCEEVGLFEDLKKVNPFDETFRRAVESGTGGSPLSADLQSPSTTALSVPCCRIGEGETLHTPHIFPSNIDRSAHDDPPGNKESVAKQRSKPKASGASRTKQDLAKDAADTNAGQKYPKKRAAVKRKAPAMVDILPKPAVVQSSQVSETIPLLIIPSGKPSSQLPVAASDPSPSSDPVLVKEKLKQHLAKVRESGKGKKEKPVTGKRSESGEEDKKNSSKLSKPIDLTKSPDEQADLKHERWKAAAKRYRLRVKNSQDQQHQRNIQLEEENLRLRTELAALKHAHRNCSVMREMKLAAALAQGTAHTIAATVGGIQELGAGTVVYNSVDPQHPISLSTPQQRLITSHIIDSHSMNRSPIFIVIGAGADSNGPVASSSALPEKGI
ncbi:cyclic AMP-dependent transcription factor ATF-7 [Anopheles ziemanni]|uniref:cyclic AMP-dependent transcription factor ATF-7 n=1 Tax=Anopheles coustani TaxID=139045 RepID=UPI002659D1A9|nr:cyclic AMP-dependent transcription factor ATF-7 [Anopheles coustani]XP_058177787.1 cyclic AMP-dependent transcription factor ATF-7 [Anopheles ziemanni]